MLSLEEVKNYLRLDDTEDDALVAHLLTSATQLCMDVARVTDESVFDAFPNSKTAVLYAIAFLYEYRDKADHKTLTLTLRSLLFGIRESKF